MPDKVNSTENTTNFEQNLLGLHRWGEVGKEASLTVGRKR